ncbi:MAG: thiamine pyrophosphate-dependent enzyme, partial [Syntrophorhabdales bacterium]
PGSEWAPVWEALARRQAEGSSALRYINCRHEVLAVSMAMGYTECTGRLPAVLLHSGVGVLHGSMALRNAYFAEAPMIVFSGETHEHTGDAEVRPLGAHWLGLLSDVGGPSSFVKGYVKWSNSVRSKDDLVDMVSRGCRMACAAPQGPVFLSVPPELLIRSHEECRVPGPSPVDMMCGLSSGSLERAARALISANRPLIISEYAGKKSGAIEKLTELAEMLAIPVFEGGAFPVRSNFPKNNPLYMGLDPTNALGTSDVIFVVGGSAPWYPPMACDESVLVILLDDDPLHPNLPYWGYPTDITLTADIEQGLASLTDMVRSLLLAAPRSRSYGKRLEESRARHERLTKEWESEACKGRSRMPISPEWFLSEARRVCPNNAMIVDETITHARLIHRYMAEPYHYIKSGYGCLGVGVGEAIGVKLAHPDRPVVLLIGDGAFNYNPVLAGLGLCQEYDMPILIVVMNNGGYMAMKSAHDLLYPEGYAARAGAYFGVDIAPAPEYAKLAAAFGAYGEKIERPEYIEQALRRGLAEMERGRAVILDVTLGDLQ